MLSQAPHASTSSPVYLIHHPLRLNTTVSPRSASFNGGFHYCPHVLDIELYSSARQHLIWVFSFLLFLSLFLLLLLRLFFFFFFFLYITIGSNV
jgi:hypothetical protein